MYRKERATIKELWEAGTTGLKSVSALRARAKDGMLVFIENEGQNQVFDRQLSVIRIRAGQKCKVPGVTWRRVCTALRALDKRDLNSKIVSLLSKGFTSEETSKAVHEFIQRELIA